MLLDLHGTNHDPRIWQEPEAFRPERFRNWDGSAFNFIPQGGGDHYNNHRCAGEWITIGLMKRAVRLLTTAMRYDVPEQVDVVAGTSSGCLNATLLAHGAGLDGLREQVPHLREIWLSIKGAKDIYTRRLLSPVLFFFTQTSFYATQPLADSTRPSHDLLSGAARSYLFLSLGLASS